jgi:hypothetical protein
MWFKGCLHIHTNSGDGVLNPEEICAWYKKHGYDFIALTDHNKITNAPGKGGESFLIIDNSIEFGGLETDLHISGIALDIPEINLFPGDYQEKIDFIRNHDGIATVNHPNWKWMACNFSQLLKLKNYHGIEIYNACMKEETGSLFAVEKWDFLLSSGRKVWGFATDDMHGPDRNYIGKGWIVVQAENLTKEEIVESIKKGNFYSSTGAVIKDFYKESDRLYISSENGEEIVFVGDNGRVIKHIEEREGSIEVGKKHKYIRCEIRSKQGIAYTQPVF